MAIKKDDVFRVCDSMFADGVAPSLVMVRTALGSGSYSTISSYLTEWKSASRSAPVVGVDDAPDEVSEVFAVALRSMWAVAQAQALAEFESQKVEFAQKLLDLANKEKEALELCEILQRNLDEFTDNTLKMQASIEHRVEVCDQLLQENAELRARHDEIKNQHLALLGKIGPITVRKDRAVAVTRALPKVAKKA